MYRVYTVTGLGYGDEGKGVTTKWLCNSLLRVKTLVIRFGGGNQVGHTVMEGDYLHEHHHTGSGTTSDVPTFYSKFCTVDPIGVVDEVNKLLEAGFNNIELIYDPRCMLVTPLDVYKNRQINNETRMSVGVGFGTTIERNENHYHLYVSDIFNKGMFYAKCRSVQDYYGMEFDIDQYYADCQKFAVCSKVYRLNQYLSTYEVEMKHITNLVFEGHQGVLLDMEYGVFPFVTRSKTTTRNVSEIIEEEKIPVQSISNYFVTRAYHTRHGDGPFLESEIKLKNNESETNHENPNQGKFRVGPLDTDLLRFSVERSIEDSLVPSIGNRGENFRRNYVVITCLDQVEDEESVIHSIKNKLEGLPIYGYAENRSPRSEIKYDTETAIKRTI